MNDLAGSGLTQTGRSSCFLVLWDTENILCWLFFLLGTIIALVGQHSIWTILCCWPQWLIQSSGLLRFTCNSLLSLCLKTQCSPTPPSTRSTGCWHSMFPCRPRVAALSPCAPCVSLHYPRNSSVTWMKSNTCWCLCLAAATSLSEIASLRDCWVFRASSSTTAERRQYRLINFSL